MIAYIGQNRRANHLDPTASFTDRLRAHSGRRNPPIHRTTARPSSHRRRPCTVRSRTCFVTPRQCPYRSRTTDVATELILQNPSETALIQGLPSRTATNPGGVRRQQSESTPSRRRPERNQPGPMQELGPARESAPSALVRYPAFLSLPNRLSRRPCAYAFFILARNKIIPPHIDGDPFNCRFHATAFVSAAKTGDWQDPTTASSM